MVQHTTGCICLILRGCCSWISAGSWGNTDRQAGKGQASKWYIKAGGNKNTTFFISWCLTLIICSGRHALSTTWHHVKLPISNTKDKLTYNPNLQIWYVWDRHWMKINMIPDYPKLKMNNFLQTYYRNKKYCSIFRMWETLEYYFFILCSTFKFICPVPSPHT